ncbi:MAG: hypothetical protein C5B44_01445 [Acidobacteria bacterium]|nr:MAG: hypothetical protein C5B44_01445 [Acidobacteriota bacterium]
MAQRNSGYAREARDKYQTPAFVTRALLPHIPSRVRHIWECAAGDGYMVRVLREAGYEVTPTDIVDGVDFISTAGRPAGIDAIITNPPYDQAPAFCAQALGWMSRVKSCGFVAMLLRIDFDSAKTRRSLFADNPHFAKKLVLLDRIRWEGIEQHTASPSYNHCWMIFDKYHIGPPTIAYAKKDEGIGVNKKERDAA